MCNAEGVPGGTLSFTEHFSSLFWSFDPKSLINLVSSLNRQLLSLKTL